MSETMLAVVKPEAAPGADVRQKVFEIEQLNGLSGPVIEAGQRLRVPAR